MSKIRELINKHREIFMYLVFGVLTTVVGWAVYFAVLWAWKGIFSLPVDDTESALYLAGYTAAHASLVSCKLEQTDAGYRYVVDFIGVNKNHRYEVDALTGEILKRSESTNKTPARNGDEIDPEMNVYPLNPAAEDSAMDVLDNLLCEHRHIVNY